MNSEQKDNLFSKTVSPGKFEFNESVAVVFDDMLERSIPFYRECQEMAVQWAVRQVQNHTNYQVMSITRGKDALGEVTVRVRHENREVVGKGASVNTIEASGFAYINAINKLLFKSKGGPAEPGEIPGP